MAACITLAGESLIAQKQSALEVLDISTFVLAYIPDLDPATPVDRAAGLPPAEQIVGTWAYTQKGFVDPNRVIYSLMLGSDIGDFDWNWIGLTTADGTLFAVSTVPVQQKRRNIPPMQTGNNVTRNFLVAFDGAQELTAITVEASTWQHDFTEALSTKQPLHANLSALSGLTGTADRMPYFTGAGALALAVLTSEARTLLSASTQSAQRSALGADDASNLTKGTIPAARVPTLNQSTTGNAGTATKLATARTLTIGGTSKAFDGGSNVTWTLAEIGTLPKGSQYIQFAETDGTFSAAKSPSTLFGGTWSLKFNTESVFFRTEGTLAAAGRSSGVQGDAIRNITGSFGPNATNNAASAQAANGAFGLSTGTNGRAADGGTSRVYSFDASRVVPTASENRVLNRLIRVWERTA